jgi:segregation and condensation protein A
MNFQELVADKKSKMEVVITFLAMLELLKQRMIRVEQGDLFGDITLHHNPTNS